MASWTSNDLCPDLKELEKKIGRKTPESLVLSIRDHALDCDDGLISDLDEKGDRDDIDDASNSFSEKIKHLKGEMRGLRRADVQILWQLVAVHEGLEALRWLEEERGAGTPASGGSSLTGSQSSLGAAEGACWPSLTPSRNSPVRRDTTPGCSPTREEPAEVLLPPDPAPDEAAHRRGRSPPKLDARRGEAGSPRDLWGAGGRNNRTQPNASSAGPGRHPGDPDAEKPYARVPGSTPPRGRENGPRGGGGGGGGGGGLKEEAKTQGGAAEECAQRSGWRQAGEDQLRAATALFGYDAQWRWVESQDDVTFL